MRRVVITGMGIYSCIGKNLGEVTDSLYNGKSGIGIDPQRKEEYRSGRFRFYLPVDEFNCVDEPVSHL